MGMSALSKQKATSLTRAAQVALALLIVGAGSALAVSARNAREAERPGKLELPTVDLPSRKAGANRAEVDTSAVAARLAAVSNHPTPVEAPKVDAPVATTPPPPPAGGDLKYLGAVGIGNLRMALVSDGGKQRFVGLGDALSGTTVQAIKDGEVTLASGRTLTLAGRSNDVVTRATPGRPGMPMGAGVPNPQAAMGGVPRPTAATLDPYNPGAMGEAGIVRAKNNIPDYVPAGLEQDFMALRDDMRSTGEFKTDEHLNEAASKRLEEKRLNGLSPDAAKAARAFDKRKLQK